MLTLNRIKIILFYLTLMMFCLPFAFPNIELFFIFIQFGLLIPIFLFLSSFSTNIYGFLLLIIYIQLLFLTILGLPGSFLGWMSMVCVGYFFGASVVKENSKLLPSMKSFIAFTVLLAFWVMFQNYQNIFSYERLSDYFEVSSINTVPILLVCTSNLYCAAYYYLNFIQENNKAQTFKVERKIIFTLCITAILSVIVFQFRSGFLIFPLLFLVAWSSMGLSSSRSSNRLIKYALLFLILISVFLLWDNYIYQFIVGLIVPGREDIISVTEELSEGALRYDRMIQFWQISAFSKTTFASWSEHLSISGMSDFVAGLFPISLIFFFPTFALFKLLKYLKSDNQIPVLIIYTASLSSLLISILQPDFFSLFSFFAISSLIYFGERSNIKKGKISSIKLPSINNSN